MIPEHEAPDLSPAARDRKHDMLNDLVIDMQKLHRRRRVRRRAITAVAVPALCLVAWWAWSITAFSPPTPRSQTPKVARDESIEPADSTTPHRLPTSIIQTVRTRPSIADAALVSTQPSRKFVTDDGLLDALAQVHRPAGLIRTDNGVWLTNDVTDPEMLR